MNVSIKLKVTTLLMALLLSACGFQLRGTDSAINLTEVYSVQVKSPYPLLKQQTERELNRQGFKVVRSEAQFVIRLLDEKMDDDNLIFDTEFEHPFKELSYQLNFSVVDDLGEIIVESQTFQMTTDYFQPSGTHMQQEVAKMSAQDRLRKQAAAHIVNLFAHQLASRESV